KELAGAGVRVNCIAPGVVRSEMGERLLRYHGDAALQTIPLGRAGEPYEIGRAAVFLASGDAAWITGKVLRIDGGAWMEGRRERVPPPLAVPAARARWVAEGESRLAQRRARAGACGDCFRADGGPGGVADLGRDGLGIAWRAGKDVRVVEAARRVAPAPHLVGERESRKQDCGG